MKRKAYMTTEELWDFAKIGVLAEEAKSIAERTSEKDWARKLKTISTYSQTIVTERLAALDAKSIKPVLRRVNNSKLRFVSNDDVRVHPDRKHEPTITIDTEMLFDILDLAILSCFKCPQGGCVKECRWRDFPYFEH